MPQTIHRVFDQADEIPHFETIVSAAPQLTKLIGQTPPGGMLYGWIQTRPGTAVDWIFSLASRTGSPGPAPDAYQVEFSLWSAEDRLPISSAN